MQLLLKDEMGLRFHKKPIYGGIAQKWWLGQFADLRGKGLAKKRGVGSAFEGGWHSNAHYVKEKKINGKNVLDLWTATGTVEQSSSRNTHLSTFNSVLEYLQSFQKFERTFYRIQQHWRFWQNFSHLT